MRVLRAFRGQPAPSQHRRDWWDDLILGCAVAVFVALASVARVPALHIRVGWAAILALVLLLSAGVCGWQLWKATRFE